MDLAGRLERILAEPTCFVGIGNPLRGDDAVGLYIADRIRRGGAGGAMVVDAEDVVENHVFQIAARDCRSVLFIDALSMDAEPGSVYLGPLGEAVDLCGGLSHKCSLGLSGKILDAYKKESYLLGVAVESAEFGTGINPDVLRSADLVSDLIVSIINSVDKGESQ